MKNITIDCARISDKAELHQALAESLRFPEWYGSNLDALYDCLTELEEDCQLTLTNWDCVASWAAGFKAVLEEAEAEVLELTVTFA